MFDPTAAAITFVGAIVLFLSLVFFWMLLVRLADVVRRGLDLRKSKQKAAAVSRLAAAQAGKPSPQAAFPPNPSADPSAPADPARSTD